MMMGSVSGLAVMIVPMNLLLSVSIGPVFRGETLILRTFLFSRKPRDGPRFVLDLDSEEVRTRDIEFFGRPGLPRVARSVVVLPRYHRPFSCVIRESGVVRMYASAASKLLPCLLMGTRIQRDESGACTSFLLLM